MGIDMSRYKVLYKGIIYNCLAMTPVIVGGEYEQDTYVKFDIPKIKTINVMYLNEENRIDCLEDKTEEFQFILR